MNVHAGGEGIDGAGDGDGFYAFAVLEGGFQELNGTVRMDLSAQFLAQLTLHSSSTAPAAAQTCGRRSGMTYPLTLGFKKFSSKSLFLGSSSNGAAVWTT